MKVFLSYRRHKDRAKLALRVAERLIRDLGRDNVFTDVHAIREGEDFAAKIGVALDECDTLLVVIGPGWLNATGAAGIRKLDDPDDWVRIEVREALHRDDVKVIPLLVGGAGMPDEGMLPQGLKKLARRQYIMLRPGKKAFESDLDNLVGRLSIWTESFDVDTPGRPPGRTRGWIKPASIAAALLLMASLPFAFPGLWKPESQVITKANLPPDPNRDGVSELAAGRPAEAVESLTRSLKTSPDRIDARRSRGQAYLALSKPDEAIADFDEVLKVTADDVNALAGRGKAFALKNDPIASRRDFARAIKLGDNDPTTHLGMAEAQALLNDDRNASIHFSKAIEAFKKDPKRDRKSNAAAYAGRAELQIKTDRETGRIIPITADSFRSARDDFNDAIDLDRANANYHARKGFLLDEVKLYEAAILELKEAIKRDPKLVKAHLSLGHSYGMLKNYPEADKAFGELIKVDPKCYEAYEKRGVLRAINRDDAGAIADYTEALKGNHTDRKIKELRLGRGACYDNLQDYKNAEEDYSKALTFGDDSWGTVRQLRARVRLRLNREAEAREDVGRVPIRADLNRQAETECFLGEAYADIGEPTKAIRCFDRAIVLVPNHWRYFDRLSRAYSATGDTVKAKLNEEMAVKICPPDQRYPESRSSPN